MQGIIAPKERLFFYGPIQTGKDTWLDIVLGWDGFFWGLIIFFGSWPCATAQGTVDNGRPSAPVVSDSFSYLKYDCR